MSIVPNMNLKTFRIVSDELDPLLISVAFRLFGFVARKSGGNNDNACHLFLDSDKNQSSASAIVGLVTKVMMGQGQFMKT